MSIFIIIYSTLQLVYTIINPYVPLSRLVGIGVLLVLIFETLKQSTKKIQQRFSICICVIIITLITCSDLKTNINDALYWLATMLVLYNLQNEKFCSKLYMELHRYRIFGIIVMACNSAIILLGLNNPACYNSTWGKAYYTCYAYSNHVFASTCCLCLCLLLAFTKDIKSDIVKIFFMLPASLGILQSGSRTFIIPLLIIWAFFYLKRVKSRNFKIIAFPIAMLTGIKFFLQSGMYQKFINPNTYVLTTGLSKFSSGRDIFWLIDINAYFNMNFINKILGSGFDFPYYVNETQYSMRIWAHNDFIDLLLSLGVMGVILYFGAFMKDIKKMKQKKKLYILLLSIYFMFVSFINGLFVYQHYVYSYMVLFAFMFVECNERRTKISENSISLKSNK